MAMPIRPDPALAAEFKPSPLGRRSAELQKLPRIFRTLPTAGKHALRRGDRPQKGGTQQGRRPDAR